MPDETALSLLRHAIATLAYRLEKTLRDAPPGFATFTCGADVRTPIALVVHLGDLIEWAVRMADGEPKWVPDGSSNHWDDARQRVFAALERLDARLAAGSLGRPASQIFQGPIADALTHVGQLAMLRRMAGAPIRPESYARARIAIGRVGADQSADRSEFDGDASIPPSMT